MSLELARPDLLWLLALLPLWWALLWPRAGWGVLFVRGEEVGRSSGDRRRAGRLWLLLPRALRSAALACGLLALTGPERVGYVQEAVERGGATAIALDLSSSMMARDLDDGASRIEVARSAAARFAAGRVHDELTLVGFAGEAVTRVPPTRDEAVVVAGIESLDVHLLRDGSDIATGLLTAVEGLLEVHREPRVVVLLSDGAHNGYRISLPAAARAAAALGVRVHGISVPGGSGATADAPAGARGAARWEGERALAAVAGITGGRYYRAPSGKALDSAYAEIGRLEAPARESERREVRRPLRASLLLLALALLGGEAVVRGSRRGVVP